MDMSVYFSFKYKRALFTFAGKVDGEVGATEGGKKALELGDELLRGGNVMALEVHVTTGGAN